MNAIAKKLFKKLLSFYHLFKVVDCDIRLVACTTFSFGDGRLTKFDYDFKSHSSSPKGQGGKTRSRSKSRHISIMEPSPLRFEDLDRGSLVPSRCMLRLRLDGLFAFLYCIEANGHDKHVESEIE